MRKIRYKRTITFDGTRTYFWASVFVNSQLHDADLFQVILQKLF